MRRGIMHDHRDRNTQPAERSDHQQVERARHRAQGSARGQVAQAPDEPPHVERRLDEAPCKAGHAGVSLDRKLAAQIASSVEELGGARQRQHRLHARERLETPRKQDRDARTGAEPPPLPDQNLPGHAEVGLNSPASDLALKSR